jgi:hypothetical protein
MLQYAKYQVLIMSNLGSRVMRIFLVFCVVLLYVYVLNSVLWCSLRFPHENDVQLSLPPVVRMRAHVLFNLFVPSGVQHILSCVFVLFFFVLLPVSLDCPLLIALRYSLTFI